MSNAQEPTRLGALAPCRAGTSGRRLSRRGSARCASDALERLEPAGADRFGERLVVPLVLVGVALGEVGDRLVEPVLLAEVRGDGDRVARSGVGPGQRLTAEPA